MTNETTPDAVERQYQDSDGNPCDLVTLCRRDPEWAANRLTFERARHAEEVARLEEQLGKLSELYDVTQERLEDFEEREPDARLCAEWAATVALKATDVYSAARRYLCGESRGTVAQVQQENDSLRAQLREVEGEREEALRMVDGIRKSEKTARESMAINMRLRDEAQAENVQLKAERDALRSLLPDVRACAEYCRTIPIGPPPLAPVALAARRILAALDSQGGEGECLDRSDARGVDGDRCESGNECGRLGCPECQS